MSLPLQLLDQAEHLALREPGKPKQASLRRSVSASYYALFHYLIDRANRQVVSGRHAGAIRTPLARVYAHKDMAGVSRAFAQGGGALPAAAQVVLGGTAIPAGVATMARAFGDLQQARHSADYDRTASLSRQDAQVLATRARAAIAAWPAVERTPAGRLFLLALLVPAVLRGR